MELTKCRRSQQIQGVRTTLRNLTTTVIIIVLYMQLKSYLSIE